MWLDAFLAYLHFSAIFLLFAFMTVEIVLLRGALDAAAVRLLGRVDLGYFGAAIGALVTGFLRLTLGAKGPDFYLGAWPIYAKFGLFLAVALISVQPTLTFVRWRRALEAQAGWQVSEAERRRIRRWLMVEVHLAALIPAIAVVMSRGLGHS